jgi:hypothetical protein
MAFSDLMDSLKGWARSTTHDGVKLASPIPDQGSIAIHQRLPLRPAAELVTDHAKRVWGARGVPDLGPAMLFTTLEGEHACLLLVRIKTADGPGLHVVAVVFGDEHAVLIDAIANMDYVLEMQQRVRSIAENYLLGLGEVRQRKYEYTPPAGWNGVRRATSTWWYHPGYPSEMAIIKVFDARPAAVTAPDILDRVLFVDSNIVPDEAPRPPIACQTKHGLMGYLVRGTGTLGGVPVTFAAAYMTDERFAYYLRLEAHRDVYPEAVKVLSAITDTLLQVPPARIKTTTSNLIHWSE